ncbi:MAG: hypothetical protein U0163_12130 [Gemmatimonadaceae bacterium]
MDPLRLGRRVCWWQRLAAIVTLGIAACGPRAAASSAAESAVTSSAPAQVQLSGTHNARGFRSAERLSEHYAKHGGEFGRVTIDEYLHLAQALRDTVAGGPILEVRRRDGVISRFDRTSGAFIAFDADGTIRTFFRPNDGERYFHRQAQRSPQHDR